MKTKKPAPILKQLFLSLFFSQLSAIISHITLISKYKTTIGKNMFKERLKEKIVLNKKIQKSCGNKIRSFILNYGIQLILQ